jgi:hypothetical protein
LSNVARIGILVKQPARVNPHAARAFKAKASKGLAMFHVVEIVTALIVAVVMAMSLAHALEFPGKRRLDRDGYFAAQTIYYPGFSVAGISEPLSIVLVFVLLLMTPVARTM